MLVVAAAAAATRMVVVVVQGTLAAAAAAVAPGPVKVGALMGALAEPVPLMVEVIPVVTAIILVTAIMRHTEDLEEPVMSVVAMLDYLPAVAVADTAVAVAVVDTVAVVVAVAVVTGVMVPSEAAAQESWVVLRAPVDPRGVLVITAVDTVLVVEEAAVAAQRSSHIKRHHVRCNDFFFLKSAVYHQLICNSSGTLLILFI